MPKLKLTMRKNKFLQNASRIRLKTLNQIQFSLGTEITLYKKHFSEQNLESPLESSFKQMEMCEYLFYFYIKFDQMLPNIYQWQSPCIQLSFQQILQYQMFYSQLYSTHQINNSELFSNFSYQSSKVESPVDYSCTEIRIQEKKKQFLELQNQKQPIQENQQNGDLRNLSMKTRQKYGRNITSNIFRSLVKRISSQNRFKKIAVKTIQQKKFEITYQNFIDQVNRLTINLSSYVKKNQMKAFIIPKSEDKLNQEFCMLFRILAKIYLRQQHTLNIFYSKKINRVSRSLHFILARQMEQMLK